MGLARERREPRLIGCVAVVTPAHITMGKESAFALGQMPGWRIRETNLMQVRLLHLQSHAFPLQSTHRLYGVCGASHTDGRRCAQLLTLLRRTCSLSGEALERTKVFLTSLADEANPIISRTRFYSIMTVVRPKFGEDVDFLARAMRVFNTKGVQMFSQCTRGAKNAADHNRSESNMCTCATRRRL